MITTRDTSIRLEKDYRFEKDYDLWFLIRTITVRTTRVLCDHVDVIIVEILINTKTSMTADKAASGMSPLRASTGSKYAAMGPTNLIWWVPCLRAVGSLSLPTTQIFTMHLISISRKPTFSRGTPSVDPASIPSLLDHCHPIDCRISPMPLRSNSPFASHTMSKPATISEVHPPSSLSHLSMGSSHAMAHQLRYITVLLHLHLH